MQFLVGFVIPGVYNAHAISLTTDRDEGVETGGGVEGGGWGEGGKEVRAVAYKERVLTEDMKTSPTHGVGPQSMVRAVRAE